MEALFRTILELSFTGGFVVLAVVILRLFLKKAPRWITCVLWGLVAIRLLCPISFESQMSLVPETESIHLYAEEASQTILFSSPAAAPLPQKSPSAQSPAPTPQASTSEKQSITVMELLSAIWAGGAMLMVGYAILSYIRLKVQVRESVPMSRGVRQSEKVSTPFLLGFIHPTIYLPFSLEASTLEAVLAHERAHIRRGDHLIKPFAFLLLSIYWFHPLIWLAYFLLSRDIEVACDEKVLATCSTEDRKRYARALLQFGVNHIRISACPLAFGELNTKERIKRTMTYKKPMFWVFGLCAIVVLTATICLLTDPKKTQEENDPAPEPVIADVEQYFNTVDHFPTNLADINAFQNLPVLERNQDMRVVKMEARSQKDLLAILEVTKTADGEEEYNQNLRAMLEAYPESFFENESLLVLYYDKNLEGIELSVGAPEELEYGQLVIHHSFYTLRNGIKGEKSGELVCVSVPNSLFLKVRMAPLYFFNQDTHQGSDYDGIWHSTSFWTCLSSGDYYWSLAYNEKQDEYDFPMILVESKQKLEEILAPMISEEHADLKEENQKLIDAYYPNSFFENHVLMLYFHDYFETGYFSSRGVSSSEKSINLLMGFQPFLPGASVSRVFPRKSLQSYILKRNDAGDYRYFDAEVKVYRKPEIGDDIYTAYATTEEGYTATLALYRNADNELLSDDTSYNCELWCGSSQRKLLFTESEKWIMLYESDAKYFAFEKVDVGLKYSAEKSTGQEDLPLPDGIIFTLS